ncbi:site-specific DNA recombinase [Salsuginibacillus halophilus]|uniref:Site-specific DNA recombinase n=1 Tax=Salsuginibacillus halophilus TaxID=517424 RepID=A0A2P8HYI0_9BACI|nr:recombinase family protein [Salsuginibacillus halophilus]PSL51280.1 site-specific DNA recombinase [Salsuginibacillus halophilus]
MSRMEAWVYARVSTEEQAARGYSLSGQVEAAEAKAKALGIAPENIHTFEEQATGASLERPVLESLRSKARERPPVYLIMYDPDRLARNLTHQLLLTDEWRGLGIELVFINFDWSETPEGMLYYQLRGMFAQYEREKIKERTARGRLEKMKKYRKLSMDPRLYGYTFNTDQDVLEVNEHEAKVIQWLFHEAAAGRTPGELKEVLDEEGISAPRGDNWHRTTIARILRNESYTGRYFAYKCDYQQGRRRFRPKEEQFQLSIPPLISEALYAAVQKELDNRRRFSKRSDNEPALLSGRLICSCGAAMRVENKGGGRRYYVCCNRKIQSCSQPYQPVQRIDELVFEQLRMYMEPYFKEAAKLKEIPRVKELKKGVQRTERSRLVRLLAAGHITAADFKVWEEAQAERARAEELELPQSFHREAQVGLVKLLVQQAVFIDRNDIELRLKFVPEGAVRYDR